MKSIKIKDIKGNTNYIYTNHITKLVSKEGITEIHILDTEKCITKYPIEEIINIINGSCFHLYEFNKLELPSNGLKVKKWKCKYCDDVHSISDKAPELMQEFEDSIKDRLKYESTNQINQHKISGEINLNGIQELKIPIFQFNKNTYKELKRLSEIYVEEQKWKLFDVHSTNNKYIRVNVLEENLNELNLMLKQLGIFK